MPPNHLEIEPIENPVDMIERLAAHNCWSFDRNEEDEISILVCGERADYNVAFTWLSEMEAMHVACAFDLRIPAPRRFEVLSLVALINEQMWIGHFDIWPQDGVIMFRHTIVLAGGVRLLGGQCEAIFANAVTACERYYQAFQFVVWAGQSGRDALDQAMFETKGEA
jgi:hypothetical protein